VSPPGGCHPGGTPTSPSYTTVDVAEAVCITVTVRYVKVVVMEVKDLSCLSPNKIVYCTMEVDGGDKLQTDQAEASKPWSLYLLLQSTRCYIKINMAAT